MYNRIILMPKYLAMYVKTDTNEGGDNINKNSKVIRECNEYMKLKCIMSQTSRIIRL